MKSYYSQHMPKGLFYKDTLSALNLCSDYCRNSRPSRKERFDEIMQLANLSAFGLEDAIAVSADLSPRTSRLLDNLREADEFASAMVGVVISAMSTISAESYNILVSLFFDPELSPEQACDVLNLTKNQLYKRRSNAISELSIALWGRFGEAHKFAPDFSQLFTKTQQ